MIDKFVKITTGFVHQTFEHNAEGKFVCSEQAFIAGDECNYENVNGETLKDVPEYEYQPYEIILPKHKDLNIKYLLYNDVLGSLENEEPIESADLEDALAQVLSNMGYSIIEAQKRKEE